MGVETPFVSVGGGDCEGVFCSVILQDNVHDSYVGDGSWILSVVTL